MKRRTVLIFVRPLAIVAALALLAAGTAAGILNTTAGTRWILARVTPAIPGELELGEFEGTLWRGLRFTAVRYRNEGRQIAASGLAVEFGWATLPVARLTISELSADSLVIDNRGVPSSAPGALDLDIDPPPIDVTIDRAQIGTIVIPGEDSTVEISNVALRNARSYGLTLRVAEVTALTTGVTATANRATLELAGELPLSARVAWRLDDDDWSGRGRLQGSTSSLEFDQTVEGPYPGTVSGTLALPRDAAPQLEALVRWQRWTASQVALVDGEARLRGWLDAWTADYALTLEPAPDRSFAVSGDASGSLEAVDAFNAVVTGPPGRAELAGSLRLRPELSATIRATGTGDILGRSAAVSGDLSVTAGRVGCRSCELRIGANWLRANFGASSDTLDGTFEFNSPDLGTLFDGTEGAARGTGTIAGSPADPRLAADLGVGSFRVGADDVPALDTTASVSAHRDGETVAVTIHGATIVEPVSGEWVLQEPFDLHAGADAVHVGPHRWSGRNGSLRIAALDVAGDTARIEASAADLPLTLANSWLPPDVQLAGTANAAVDLALDAGLWSGSLEGRLADTVLRVTERGGDVNEVVVSEAGFTARLTDGALEAHAVVGIEPGVTGELRFALTALRTDAEMTGNLRLTGDEWGWIAAVVPQIDRFQGTVAADLTAAGPLHGPELAGNLSWHDGSLLVPALAVPLSDIDVVVSGARAGGATLRGTARAGGGSLAIDGRFADVMRPGRSVELHVTGDAAQVVNWPEYRVWATPDLVVTGDEDGWRVAGKLAVPRADFEIREMPAEAVPLSDDIVVAGETPEEARTTPITGEATIELGKRVHVSALGLETGLTGTLAVRLREGRPVTAEGRVALTDGVFTAYGQKLTISQGELRFTGPLDNPLVDVKAIRVIDTLDAQVTAGIRLRGRAQNLTTTVFSEPAMAEADALSYLVVGRPLNQATEAEGGDLAGAAVALGLRQTARITDQIGQAIGLDQLSLTGDGGGGTALFAGKQLNSRLYARYSYGVFSRLGSLLLRYRMSKRLTLEAGTGENQSIDVLYSVEKL